MQKVQGLPLSWHGECKTRICRTNWIRPPKKGSKKRSKIPQHGQLRSGGGKSFQSVLLANNRLDLDLFAIDKDTRCCSDRLFETTTLCAHSCLARSRLARSEPARLQVCFTGMLPDQALAVIVDRSCLSFLGIMRQLPTHKHGLASHLPRPPRVRILRHCFWPRSNPGSRKR